MNLLSKYEIVWNRLDGAENTIVTVIYFMQFRSGDYSNTNKMMLIK